MENLPLLLSSFWLDVTLKFPPFPCLLCFARLLLIIAKFATCLQDFAHFSASPISLLPVSFSTFLHVSLIGLCSKSVCLLILLFNLLTLYFSTPIETLTLPFQSTDPRNLAEAPSTPKHRSRNSRSIPNSTHANLHRNQFPSLVQKLIPDRDKKHQQCVSRNLTPHAPMMLLEGELTYLMNTSCRNL